VVTVIGRRPTSLPTQIPTTTEGVTREDIERTVNATDSEDALKYFPSLLVRKRYIGDYNHAILSSRASGTGNSARSAVYADGILLSNYLGNGVGGLSFAPRWGLVTPEEIERVDVMYGPFSAAYAGNSVGAVVDYVTRMPTRFEAHAKVGLVAQPFELYGMKTTYRAWAASTSVGSRDGDWSWWINVNRTDSDGQPLTFATRLASSGVTGSTGTAVTGAVAGLNSANQPWLLLGAGTQYRTAQDHLKLKLAYDLAPTLRASYVFGAWRNEDAGVRAASAGHDVVMCPEQHVYLDHRQSPDPGEPIPVGEVHTLEDVYAYEPALSGARLRGVQAQVWSEHLDSARRVDYMAFPRLSAFAEVAWSSGSRDYAEFLPRLRDHHLPRLDALGVEYRPLDGPHPWQTRPGVPGRPR